MKEAISMECWCPPTAIIFFRVPGSIPTDVNFLPKLFYSSVLSNTKYQHW